MRDPGPILDHGNYGKSRSFRGVGIAALIFFGGATAFVFFLATKLPPGRDYDKNIGILHQAELLLGAITVLVGGGMLALLAAQVRVELHERAIRIVGRRREQTDFYGDLEDLHFAYMGNLVSYRATATTPWTILDGRITRFAELKKRLRQLQVAQRAPLLLARLQAGETVRFRYFSDFDALAQVHLNPRRLDQPTHEIELTARTLTVAGKTVDVARLGPVTTNLWLERARIVDVDGNVVHALHTTAILSLDLMCAVIAALQGQPLPA